MSFTATTAQLVKAGVGLVLLTVTAGCDTDGKSEVAPPPRGGRADAVTAESGAPSKATAAPTAKSNTKKKPRVLCENQSPIPAPTQTLVSRSAEGVMAAASQPSIGAGKWVWMNFWAAWCKPCKEEMPRIVAWEKKLQAANASIEVAFVSIDDDERQMQRFLDKQPADGVKQTYFLPEGEDRVSFLTSAGLGEAPELPVHVLISPKGEIACTIRGAIEDDDYPAFASFVGASK